MFRKFAIGVLAILAVGAGLYTGGLYSLSDPPTAPNELPHALIIDADSVSLGEVWEDRAFRHTVRVQNRGGEAIRVEGATCGCTGLTAEQAEFELAAGATQDVQITLDLSNHNRQDAKPAAFTAPLKLKYAAASQPGQFRQAQAILTGSVKSAILSKPVWNLGQYSRKCGIIEKRFEFHVPESVGTVTLVTKPNPWHGEFKLSKKNGSEGVYEVLAQVVCDQEIPAGLLTRELQFIAASKDGAPLPAKSVIVEAEVSPSDIRIDPPSIYFGGVPKGEVIVATIHVNSHSGAPVHIARIEPTRPGVEVTPAGRPNEFFVKLKVVTAGQLDNAVEIAVRIESELIETKIAVKAIGVERYGN